MQDTQNAANSADKPVNRAQIIQDMVDGYTIMQGGDLDVVHELHTKYGIQVGEAIPAPSQLAIACRHQIVKTGVPDATTLKRLQALEGAIDTLVAEQKEKHATEPASVRAAQNRRAARIQDMVDAHTIQGMWPEAINEHLLAQHGVQADEAIGTPSLVAIVSRNNLLNTGVLDAEGLQWLAAKGYQVEWFGNDLGTVQADSPDSSLKVSVKTQKAMLKRPKRGKTAGKHKRARH